MDPRPACRYCRMDLPDRLMTTPEGETVCRDAIACGRRGRYQMGLRYGEARGSERVAEEWGQRVT